MIDRQGRDITVFNDKGMEIYRFGEEGELGSILDGAVDPDGNILLLLYRRVSQGVFKYLVLKCDFRGKPVSEIELMGFPPEFSAFAPDRLVLRDNRLYLAQLGAMQVAVTDENGHFLKGYNILPMLELSEKDKKNVLTGMFGFWVDREGNLLFTVPGLFHAFRLSPDEKITAFGIAGSGPGKFGIASGITTDDRGYIYVSDRLRCVVLVFGNSLQFQTEFGYRGYGKGNLIVPGSLAVDAKGRLYVSQAANRGVSVFRITGASGTDRTNISFIPGKEAMGKGKGTTSSGKGKAPVLSGGIAHPPKKVNPS
ncbi:MAG: hypothetical protein HKM86_03655 [Deltaproteobacteria bacterium]|nr:hypothetical protein [Deltaproteobacteria bacterium]